MKINKLVISTEVYSLQNIQKSCEIYKDYAKIIIKKKQNRVILIFKKCKYDPKLTIKEFENYLINVENSRTWK